MAAKHELKIQESHALDFATWPWPSLCEQSELQCYRPGFSLRHALQVIDSRPKVTLLAAEGNATRGRG